MRVFFLLSILLILLTSCAYFQPKKPAHPPEVYKTHEPAVKKVQPKPVDTEAQQRLYDQGIKYYLEENYEEARKAWQQVIQIGSASSIAAKAKENLKKTERVLKTLNEIENNDSERKNSE